MFLVFIVMLVYFGAGLGLIVTTYRRMGAQRHSFSSRIGVAVLIGFSIWAIPFADHTIGKMQFESLCKREAGLRIYKIASDVEGFRSPFASGNTPSQLGYRFVEEIHGNGTVTRFTLLGDKTVLEEKSVIPKSRYVVDQRTQTLSAQITRSDYLVADTKDNQRLAEYTQFGHHGGWLMRQLAAMHAYRNVCPETPFNLSKVIVDVLRPKIQGY